MSEASDATDEHEPSAEVSSSERLFRAVFDASDDAMLLSDDAGVTIDANPAACALFALPKNELLGSGCAVHLPPRSDPSREWAKFLARRKHRGQMPLARSSGDIRTLSVERTAFIVPGRHLSVFRDVTESKSAEHQLRQSEYFLAAAQTVAHVGSWVAGLGMGDRVLWSRECYRIFGIPEGTPLTVQTVFDHVHRDDLDAVSHASREAIERGVPYELEHRIVCPDGEVRWIAARARVEYAPDGTALRLIGIAQDITEQRRILDELLASEQRYRRLIETTSEGALVVGTDLRISFANARVAEMLGYEPEEILGLHVHELLRPADRTSTTERMEARRLGTSETRDQRLRTKQGADIWVSMSSTPVFDVDGRFEGAFALLTNITERRRADVARNRLAAIVESSEDAIVSTDLDGVFTSWNRGAERLFGFSEAEMVGRSCSVLAPPELGHEPHLLLQRIGAGEPVENYETKRLRHDGSLLEIALTISPICDATGAVFGLSMVARDLTERRKAELALRRSEQQLRQAQKMEAIGSLAGGVAHDFNNLLSVILSYTRLLINRLTTHDPISEDLAEIEQAAKRAAVLTRQLLAFSRQQVLQPRVVDVGQVVLEMENMLRRLVGEDIELVVAPEAGVGGAFADPNQLEQVVMNLVANARDAMPRGGTLTIEIGEAKLDAMALVDHRDATPGSFVRLTVRDTGTGIEPAARPRIFDPFFTTKEKGKGTGLGLSTVLGIVHQSGGAVFVDSEVGKGASFSAYFPRAERAVVEASTPAGTPSLRGSETVLLVEDDEQVRVLARTILRRSGYEVLEAQNAGEAFLVCERFGGRIDLLLTDVVMPRMSGRELAARLEPLRPQMRVLFMSGHTEDAVLHHGVSERSMAFLQKPLTPDELLKKVREVLDPSRAHSNRPAVYAIS